MTDEPVERKEQEMGEEAERMEDRLGELDDHIADAKKKSQLTREHADLDDEPPDSET